MNQGNPNGRAAELEREEVEAILSSTLFAPNSNPSRLLRYICEKYFTQTAGELKEYTIAVDVFGRPASFDNRQDSIVRVEASRLRKRLQDYYANEGATHALRVTIPPGRYVPEFVSQTGEAAEVTVEKDTRQRWRIQAWQWITAGAVLSGLAGAILYVRTNPGQPSAPVVQHTKASQAPAAPAGSEVRILAGSDRDRFVDRAGNEWQADRYFEGGQAVRTGAGFIARTLDPTLYQTMRTGAEFAYRIPLRPGIYELRLHFAETTYGPDLVRRGGETSRLMIVRINGQRILYSYDVYLSAGGHHTAEVQVFRDISPAQDGKLHLEFSANWDRPFINAIEVVPSERGKMRPIRLVARDQAQVDRAKRVWSPDTYFSGGRLEVREDPPRGASDPEVYTGERYGRFSYAIPVTPGSYRVTLYFVENWFKEGTGKRVFDVWCNGTTLLKGFDIAREAGGPRRVLEKTFRGIRPTAHGKIELSFVPVVNYALVNAIEVVDEFQ